MKKPALVRRLSRKPRFLFAYAAAGLAFVFAYTTEPALRLGIVLVLLGETIRFWSNGYVGHLKVNESGGRGYSKIGQLITAGPYAFVRNPLYLGSFLIGIGFCVVVGNLWLGLAAVAFFFLLYRRQIQEEEETLRHEWNHAYRRYHAAVPRWVPTGRRYPHRSGTWSWKGIVASKEWETGVWAVVLLTLFYFREEFFQEHELFTAEKWGKHVILFGTAALLIASDAMVRTAQHLIHPRSFHRSSWVFRQRKYLPVPLVILGIWVVIHQGHPFRPGSFPRKGLDLCAWSLVLCGEALRIWGVGHIGRKSRSSDVHASRLVTNGPYAYTRNPLYLGGFFLTLGLSLLTGSLWIAAGCLAYWALIYNPIIREEERFLTQTFGQAYTDYCRTVPRWWPRLHPAKGTSWNRWRWGELRKEYQTVASVLVIVFLIQTSQFGSEWLHGRQLRQQAARRTRKTEAVQVVRPRQEPQVPSSVTARDVAYQMHVRGGFPNVLMQDSVRSNTQVIEQAWHDEAAGIIAGLSAFVAAAVIQEIDDIHDKERFNVVFADLFAAAAVGDSTRHLVLSRTQRSFPESAYAFSPQEETSTRRWGFFVASDREVGIAITYSF